MSKNIEGVVLERALALVREGHCIGDLAATKSGRQRADWFSKRAKRFCAVGAIRRASLDILGPVDGQRVALKVIKQCGGQHLVGLNDVRGKDWVIARFEKALAEM